MISVPVAIVDFIPVILFCIAAVILQRGLYYRMSKGAYALLAAGTIMIVIAGLFKAIWKLLLALDVCDFDRLNKSFFPMQSVGFLLAGMALMAMVFVKQEGHSEDRIAAVVFAGTWIFIPLMILGLLGMCIGLSVEAKRRKKTPAVVMFIIACVFMLMMGYLSSRSFEKESMNWIAECVNIAGCSAFLMGSRILTKEKS